MPKATDLFLPRGALAYWPMGEGASGAQERGVTVGANETDCLRPQRPKGAEPEVTESRRQSGDGGRGFSLLVKIHPLR